MHGRMIRTTYLQTLCWQRKMSSDSIKRKDWTTPNTTTPDCPERGIISNFAVLSAKNRVISHRNAGAGIRGKPLNTQNTLNVLKTHSNYSRRRWCLDSGATSHLCNKCGPINAITFGQTSCRWEKSRPRIRGPF